MPEIKTVLLFCSAALVILLTPGPAVLYIVNRSVSEGFKSGFVSSIGMLAGGAVHLVAALVGVAAILMASPVLFMGLKLSGAGYLVFLGVQQIRLVSQRGDNDGPPRSSHGTVFRQALVVNLLNPKAIIFLFAFLPQFIDPGAGEFLPQAAVLGGAFLILALASDSSWAFVAARFGDVLRRSPSLRAIQVRLSAGVYIALGLATALLAGSA